MKRFPAERTEALEGELEHCSSKSEGQGAAGWQSLQ